MYTDPKKLKQILINLIDNAIKFTEEGHIEVGTGFTTPDKICFYVKDTGIGISEKHQKDIFGSFQKIEDSVQKLYRGAGLGLTLCKGLVKLLDGEITVESRHLKGTEFKIIFPFEETTVGVSNQPTETNQKKDSSKLKGKTILVAEDVSSNLLYLKEITSLLGINLIEASNGNEAIEKVAQNASIDLILMDILMPEKDGFEAARQIRKIHKNIPIIAQSAFTWNESKKFVYQGVFDDYLTKPFSKEQLTELLTKYL
jgi:CheY-like chemotaxis protein/anti-sigma regulatory factor (Ser/Thr protein kinase)